MGGGIYGINGIYGVNGVYGVSRSNGLNTYNSYTSDIVNRQMNQVTSLLNSAAENARLAGAVKPGSDSYLSRLNQSMYSIYLSNSIFSSGSKLLTSSDDNAVSAAAQRDATEKSYSIKVTNLAVSQLNTGLSLNANDKSVIGAGLNLFKIKTGAFEKTIPLAINSADTNKTALTKLASAINRSDTGVKASVLTDSDNKTTLMVESSKTGTKNAFSLTDINGNAISSTGLDKVKTKAQDAVYSLDGKQYSSSSNTISLDAGKVRATLKKAVDNEVTLTVPQSGANNRLPDFYSYYDGMLSPGRYDSRLVSETLMNVLL